MVKLLTTAAVAGGFFIAFQLWNRYRCVHHGYYYVLLSLVSYDYARGLMHDMPFQLVLALAGEERRFVAHSRGRDT